MKTDAVENLSPMPAVTAPRRKGKEQSAADGAAVRDPREMERAELEAYLQSTEHFPTKTSLLEFARRYNVPVNARTQREEIIRLCLRMIHDIPASFAGLRAAERPPVAPRAPETETRKALADFFVGAKPEEHAEGHGVKRITSGLLDGILHCHEAGLLLTQVRGADADMFLQALETCESPIDTHVRFLSNVVDFARLEAGKYEFAHTPLRLRDCVGEALKRLAFPAHQKHLELCYSVQADAPERVVGDPARLQQVLIALVDNAIKFTERGEVVVEVKRGRPDDPAATETRGREAVSPLVHFSVRDTGVGMAQEQLRALTRLFTSGGNGDKLPLGGLGLTIAHRLVELMGGRMWIASEADKGTECSFSLRLQSDKSNAGEALNNLNSLRERRILVVDDNKTQRRLLSELLSSWGAQAYPAANGREALSLLYKQAEDDPFAAIVIDGHLADMEGFASIRRQHLADEAISVSPMIMMLATVDPLREMERYRELHVAAFLQKPLTPAELLQALLEASVSGATSPEEDVLDRTALWSLVSGDTKLLKEVIGLFDHDCPRLLFALHQAVFTEHRQDVVAAAHALKGVVGHFAARGVLRAVAVVESFGGQGDFAHAHETLPQLTSELLRLKQALNSLGRELAAPHAEREV